MDAEWALVTLEDALDSLAELIQDVESDPDACQELMDERMPAVFAKLNYAWNTRHLGPTAVDTHDHDELVAWPKDVPGL